MPKKLLGTVWGRTFVLLLAVLGAATAARAAEPRSTIYRTPELNLAGQHWVGVQGIEYEGQPWLEFRLSSGANKPTSANGFTSYAGVVDHKYYRLRPDEVAELAANLAAWYKEPHSDSVFSVGEDGIAFAATGNAWNPDLQPVVILQITCWVHAGRGSVHGGEYLALNRRTAKTLSEALATWAGDPTPTAGFIFERLVM